MTATTGDRGERGGRGELRRAGGSLEATPEMLFDRWLPDPVEVRSLLAAESRELLRTAGWRAGSCSTGARPRYEDAVVA